MELIPSSVVADPDDTTLLAQWRAGDADAGQALFERRGHRADSIKDPAAASR
jgi:hypothetical protein